MKWENMVYGAARLLGWIGFLGNTAFAVIVSLGYLVYSVLPGRASLGEALTILLWVLAFTMYAAIGYIAARGDKDRTLTVIRISKRWKFTMSLDPITLLIAGAVSAALPVYILVQIGLF